MKFLTQRPQREDTKTAKDICKTYRKTSRPYMEVRTFSRRLILPPWRPSSSLCGLCVKRLFGRMLCNQPRQLPRKRRLIFAWFSRDRVREAQVAGMQGQASWGLVLTTVFVIAQDRAAGFRELHADLVSSACLEFQFEQTAGFGLLDDLVLGDGQAGSGTFFRSVDFVSPAFIEMRP